MASWDIDYPARDVKQTIMKPGLKAYHQVPGVGNRQAD
jgi:hypothetical protein